MCDASRAFSFLRLAGSANLDSCVLGMPVQAGILYKPSLPTLGRHLILVYQGGNMWARLFTPACLSLSKQKKEAEAGRRQ